MKFAKIIPVKLFRRRNKSRSAARFEADPSSSSSENSFHQKPNGAATPTSVLLPTSRSTEIEISPDEMPEISAGVYLELKQAFEMIDRDGDGKIRKEELEGLLCRLMSQEEMKSMLNEVDRDGDGCISLQEFYAIGSAFAPPTGDGELRETFEFFDSDGDGRISAEELFNVFRALGDARCTLEDCRRMIGGVDTNGEGFVCFADFSRMMDPQLPPHTF